MKEEQKNNIPWWQSGLHIFLRLSGWIVFPVITAIVVGRYLDRVFNSAPWAFLLSVAVAFIVSIVMIVSIGLKEMDKKQ